VADIAAAKKKRKKEGRWRANSSE